MTKTPVHILSGFLGAGKTTAILRLLAGMPSIEKWAVIVNEFGKIPIDSEIVSQGSASGEVYEVSGGCICCTAQSYFRENLEKIVTTGVYDRILIEPSGLGGVDWVSQTVSDFQQLTLMPVFCLVDVTTIENRRFQLNPVYQKQICQSPVIVFTKCDLVPDKPTLDKLMEKFRIMHPTKQFLPGDHLKAEFFGNAQPAQTHKSSKEATTRPRVVHPEDYRSHSFTFKDDRMFDPHKLLGLFSSQPDIVRAKGFVRAVSGWKLVHYTLTGHSVEEAIPQPFSQLAVIVSGKNTRESFLVKEIEGAMINQDI